MIWLKTIISLSPDSLDEACAKLAAMGVDSFQIEDERDIAESWPGWEMVERELLDYYSGLCRIIAYLPDAEDGRLTLNSIRAAFHEVAVESADEEDWAESWKKYYKPFAVGRRLLIHPAWEPLGDSGGKVVFLNNPGMTFGTGLHASTRLCLELIDTHLSTGCKMLDIGSGSGILSVCALLLGAGSAVCVDIDPLAVGVALENAARNGVAVSALCGDILVDTALRGKLGGGYGLICSNIVADVIISLCQIIPGLLARDGVWIASGIIDTRLGEVEAALSNSGFDVFSVTASGSWAAVAAKHT